MFQKHLNVLQQVLGKAGYLFLFISTTLVLGLSLLLWPSRALLLSVFTSEAASLGQKVMLLVSVIGSFLGSHGLFSTVIVGLVTLLFSLNVTVFVYYVRRAQKSMRSDTRIHLSGVAGLISGLLGIGCVACGSIILTALLSSVGATGFLLLLPLHGGEFGLLGLILLGVSIHLLVSKINDPLTCSID